MQNTLDWRQMSALAPASCVGLAGGHLSGRTDGRTSGDKGGGDEVAQGAAQGRAWNLSPSTPCHGLLSRPLEKTQRSPSPRAWRPDFPGAPVFLPGESQGQGSLMGCCLWGRTESDTPQAPRRAPTAARS